MTRSALPSLVLLLALAAACSRTPAERPSAEGDGSPSPGARSEAAPTSSQSPGGTPADTRVQLAPTAGGISRIPLVAGLTVVTAIVTDRGDYESVKQITGIDGKAVSLTYSADVPDAGFGGLVGGDLGGLLGGDSKRREVGGDSKRREVRHVRGRRRVVREDLQRARAYMHLFGERLPETIPGSTALGVSAAVLADLKTKGESSLTMRSSTIGTGLSSLIGAFGGDEFKNLKEIRDLEEIDKVSGTIRRVEPGAVPIRVLVNGQPTDLPAIHARGKLGERDGDFYFLDDPDNPLALKWTFGDDRLQVVKIAFTEKRAADPKPARIEMDLEKTGRAEVYGIHFDFDSDVLRPESRPVLEEIAAALREHADWKLSVEGHTDNVGTDEHNLDLSRRRAAAVKKALVDRHGIADRRLSPAGFGASRPKDTNDTVEGRARNRRVELARQAQVHHGASQL